MERALAFLPDLEHVHFEHAHDDSGLGAVSVNWTTNCCSLYCISGSDKRRATIASEEFYYR